MRTLVISGGSSGIGKSTASLFAERGWRVFELVLIAVATLLTVISLGDYIIKNRQVLGSGK